MSHQLVVEVLKRVLVEIETPTPLVIPEATLKLDDVDDYFERLLSEPTTTTKPSVEAAAPGPVSGTKPITIRLRNRVINAFKAEAIKTGMNYQTLMHRALADAADELAL